MGESTTTTISAGQRSAVLGAMFLMATSAIGPGFITQTTSFTVKLQAAFAFTFVLSILVDIAVQLNVWRVIGISGERAHELGNKLLPGLGWVLAAFVVFGGLVFNIGNIAGTGLGVNAMLGVDPLWGGVVSSLLAIGIFLSKKAGAAVDRIVVVLGFLMIALTIYVAITSNPPVGAALKNAVLPEKIDVLVITSDNEGLTLTALEADRKGVVVLSADVGSQVTVVVPELLAPATPDAFLRHAVPALHRLADDPDLLAGLRRAQLELHDDIRARESASEFMRRYYAEILKEPR